MWERERLLLQCQIETQKILKGMGAVGSKSYSAILGLRKHNISVNI